MINLLINILIIIVCIFIVYFLLANSKREPKYRDFIICSISLVSVTFCILFPYYTLNGNIYDLRAIPFLLGALYGGKKVAFNLLLGLILVRFFIGYDIGFFKTVGQGLAMFLFVVAIQNHFLYYPFLKKLMILTMFLAFIWIINFSIYYFFFEGNLAIDLLGHLINYFIILISILALMLFIIEYIIQNVKYKKEITASEKLRVVSQLAASVSHDVRNPLTVTRGFLQLLKDDTITYEKQKEYLDLSLQELDRAQLMITNYLTFARPNEEGSYKELDVKKEIEYLVQVMTPYALMFGIEIRELSLNEGVIFGDRQKLRQIFINLSKNAIEAMPNGGKLIISSISSNRGTVVSIKDTGIGMTKEQLGRLGEPLFTNKKFGSGLGIMVAFKIIQELGGKVKVKSQKGIGTEFTLRFPYKKGDRTK